MNKSRFTIRAVIAATTLTFVILRLGAQTMPVSAAGKSGYTKAADNKIYAQHLVNELMTINHDLMSVGVHAMRPGSPDYFVVAHSQDLIGKKDSAADLGIITGDQTIIGPESKGYTTELRMVVHASLHDSAGNIIGMVVFSFKPRADMDKLAYHLRADRLLSELVSKIPNADALFSATP